MNNPERTDPAAARSRDPEWLRERCRSAATALEAVERSNLGTSLSLDQAADVLRWAADALAALAAARLAHQQENEQLKAKNEALWAESEGFLARTHQAEAARTALRQDLQALPRYAIVMKLHAFNVASAASALRVDGEFIKASDLADRLAREEQATD